ncbi:MAG: ATP-binding protein [Candidatus Marinimicrobia bacterium]|nr:ATP-binding protein [Candidatus Neomarinimicrobiota bacterium]
MIHRDYFVNSNVQINISPDKVEIINPGKLLFPKSDFGKVSVRRNPILVDLVHRLGLVEKAGSGIKRIKGLTKKYKTKVKFETGDFFTTIFFRETDLKKIERKSNANPTQIRRKSDTNPTQIRRNWILTFLENENKITNKIIREKFMLHKDTVSKGLRDMIAQNEIIQKGDGNNIWFELDPKQIEHKSNANRTQIEHKSNTKEFRTDWIISFIQKNGSIKSKNICNEFNVVKNTAFHDLHKLIIKNKIIKKGAGNNVWYELNK